MVGYALLYAGSAALLKGLGFLLSLWVAKVLAPEQYGLWGLAYASQVGIGTFGIVGIQEAIVGLLHKYSLHKYSKDAGRQSLYAAAMRTLASTLSITLALSVCGIFFISSQKEIGFIGIAGVMSSGALLALATLQAQISRLEEDHLSSLAFSFLIPLAGVAGSAIAFTLSPATGAFFLGSGLGMLLLALVLKGRLRGLSGSVGELPAIRGELLQRIWPFILVAFFGWVSGYGSNFIVDRLFGLKDVAQLTFLLTIGSVLQLLTTALNQVWSPRFYRLVHSNADGAAIERLNRRFYSYQSWGLGAFAAACLAGMPLLLDFAGGQLSNYRDMRLEMWLIFSGYIILVLWTHCQNYLLVYDKGNLLMHVVLITSLIGVAVWIPLMLLLGPIGIYLGFFFQMLVRTLGIIIAARKWHLRLCWASTAGAIVLAAIPILFPIA